MDWLRSCLPTCLQWQRHQADTEEPVGLGQTREEINASSRLLDALSGGAPTRWTPAMLTEDAFVNISIEAVQHEVKRKLWDEELQKLEESAAWHGTQVDLLAAYCAAGSAHNISELTEYLEERQLLLASYRDSLDGLLKQIRTIKEDRTASIRAQKRLLERLYSSSQNVIDASEASGKIGRLDGTYLLCDQLKTCATLKTAMEETRAETRSLQQSYIDASRALRCMSEDASIEERKRMKACCEEAKAKWHSADCQLGLQEKSHRQFASNMLLNKLLPLLVKQGLHPAPFSPKTSTNGHELDVVQDHDRERRDCDAVHLLAGQGLEYEAHAEMLHKIKKTKNSIGKSSRRLEKKRKARIEGLAAHLRVYPKATVESFDEWYTAQNNGRSFLQSRNESLQWIEDKQKKYRSLLTKAQKQGLEDVPLSPISFADRTGDGDNSTVERDLEAGKTRGGILKQRKMRRWQRGVAEDFESSPSSSSRSSRLSPGLRSFQNRCEISDVDGKSKKKWLKRYEQQRERLRQSGMGRELQTDEDKQREVYDAQVQLIDASISARE